MKIDEKERSKELKKCNRCGRDYTTYMQFWPTRKKLMPSQSLYCGKCRSVNLRAQQTKNCVVCGAVMKFEDYPKFRTRKTCSDKCNNVKHVFLGRSTGWQERTLSTTAIANKALSLFERPGTGGNILGPQNRCSKDYIFISPSGEKYEIHNLMDWVRNNQVLFSAKDVEMKPRAINRHPVHRGRTSNRPGSMWCNAYNGLMALSHGRRSSWKWWTLPGTPA